MATQIPPFTKTPSRQQPATFSADMDTRLSEENSRIIAMNAQSDENNVISTQVTADKAVTTAKASEASLSASEAADSASIALNVSDYKGDWVANYNTTGYSQSMSVTLIADGKKYVSKIDNNLATPISETNDTSWDFLESVSPEELALKAPLASPTFTGAVAGISKAMVGLANVDNTSDENKPVSIAQQTVLDLKANQSTTYNKTEVDSAFVNLTTTQTIAGVKTFSSSPIMPTPALGDNSTKGATTAFVLANKSSILRPTKTSPSSITVDGTLMSLVTPTAGTDYYFSKTAIQTVKDANTIGGFHYGLTAEAEAPTGNKTEADMVLIRGINAYSIWTKWFRPVCEPEGMVFIGSKWYDIYLLNSEHITNGTSKAGATIAGGTTSYGRAIPKIPLAYGGNGTLTYGKLTWFQLCEIAKSHSKELITYAEFPTIAYGVNEGKSSSTNGYETVAGKVEHYSNLTSKFGIEQASGVHWVWGKDLSEYSGTRVYQAQTDGRGSIYAAPDSPTAVLLGGARSDGVDAGSRASIWLYYVWHSHWYIGSRFSCDHLEVQ